MKLKTALLLPFSIIVIGCSGVASTEIDDQIGQSGQGKDRWEAEFEGGHLKKFIVDLGRDKDNVQFSIVSPTLGTITYNVGSVSGAEQARIRAEIEAFVSQNKNKDVMYIMDGILKILTESGLFQTFDETDS